MISKPTEIDTLINSRCQANIIYEEVVKNLGLEIKPHPKPYPLGWVCIDSELNVSHQCKLNFNITSGYVDEFELDTIRLDICGIVLSSI